MGKIFFLTLIIGTVSASYLPCHKVCGKNEVLEITKYEDPTCDGDGVELCKPIKACRCIEGYVRHDGQCIKSCECPIKCKCPNEVLVWTNYEDPTCDGDGKKLCKAEKACRCKKGYVRHNGKCIKKCKCPKICEDKYEPVVPNHDCYENHKSKKCDHDWSDIILWSDELWYPIPEPCHEYPKSCEKPQPVKCKCPNEEYIFTKYEDDTCDGQGAKLCKPEKACRCKIGYVRHNGKCIKKCKCPEKCEDHYEPIVPYKHKKCDYVPWHPLPEPCFEVPEPCYETPKPYEPCHEVQEPCKPCHEIKEPCDRSYEPIVPLKKHYKKKRECPKPEPEPESCEQPEPPKCECPNEEYVYTQYEDATCDEEAPKLCEPVKACRCKEGYVRYNGKCIEKCECPIKCKDPNEEYVLTKYEDATCDKDGEELCEEVKACRCKEGYVRHNGKCIEKCDCPVKCKDPNEEYVFTKYEDATCDEDGPKLCEPVKACRCKKGYVRHNGKCILKCDCPVKCKDPNEVYIYTKYEDATCDKEAPEACKPVKACRCKEGYLRHNGKCIPKCDCPVKCKDPNEEYIFTKYEDATCDEDAPKLCEPVKACRCKKGYVRHNGKCILKCDCPVKCKDPNEEYIFTKYEDPTCDEEAPKLCKPIKACRCKQGFVRHNGKCIPKCDCPPKCKGPNEEYIFTKYEDPTCDEEAPKLCEPVKACRCKKGYVRHQGKCIEKCDCPPKCKDPNEEYIFTKYEDATCDKESPELCKPVKACRCKKGYVRHNGKCIPKCDCPVKCKDPNEEYIFTKYEDATCNEDAPKLCEPVKACRCKKGYVRHNGKCILKCDCPVKCKDPNEEYIFTKYEDATCDEDAPKLCEPVKACRCKKGYVRHNGKCILKCDCPVKCKDPNEVYIFTKYEDATCDKEAPEACKPVKACRCKKGYVRHNGKCIPKCDCPVKCKDPNEEYIFTKYEDATCDEDAPKLCEPVKACRCKKGFVRHHGKCIPKCDCPPKCKDSNEEYVLTKYEDATCHGEGAKLCEAVKACRCREGYVRHCGKCIPKCDCPDDCEY